MLNVYSNQIQKAKCFKGNGDARAGKAVNNKTNIETNNKILTLKQNINDKYNRRNNYERQNFKTHRIGCVINYDDIFYDYCRFGKRICC